MILHKIGKLNREIAAMIPCSEQILSLWVSRWRDDHLVSDAERSGRPRCTSEETDVAIECYAVDNVNANPRDIVREMDLPTSARTVRRRLDEVGLHGRVQRDEHVYTDEEIRHRFTFAEGYGR